MLIQHHTTPLYITQYYPKDCHGTAYSFRSKLLQMVVKDLMPAMWAEKLRAMLQARLTQVHTSAVKIQALARAKRARNMVKQQFFLHSNAAIFIQVYQSALVEGLGTAR